MHSSHSTWVKLALHSHGDQPIKDWNQSHSSFCKGDTTNWCQGFSIFGQLVFLRKTGNDIFVFCNQKKHSMWTLRYFSSRSQGIFAGQHGALRGNSRPFPEMYKPINWPHSTDIVEKIQKTIWWSNDSFLTHRIQAIFNNNKQHRDVNVVDVGISHHRFTAFQNHRYNLQ